jgi:hypothetical protein
MCRSVHLRELREVEVRIDRGSGDADVSEQLLDVSDAPARLEHMRRAGMPEYVRRDTNRDLPQSRPFLDALLHGPTREAPTIAADE